MKRLFARQVSGSTIPVHCAMLGDGMVGKTCLTVSYSTNRYVNDYTSTIHDEYIVLSPEVNGEQIVMSVYDTAGQSDFEDLRAYAYMESEVLVLCFSVCDRDSFYSVCTSWIPEIKRHTKRRRPVILVGTQTDKRRGGSDNEVTLEEGEQLANIIGAHVYVECSAKNGSGLEDVFSSVISCALRRRKRKSSFIKRLFHR